MIRRIRLATRSDAESILNIYAPYITDTIITLEYDVPTLEVFEQRIATIQEKSPYLVCEIDGAIAGYAYASTFNERAGYNWDATFSIFLHPHYHRQGIGRALYFSLFEILKLQGIHNVYAGVTLPNKNSESLHEAMGFTTAAIYTKTGFKFDNWHDVKWYEQMITPYRTPPLPLKTIDQVSSSQEFKVILETSTKMIKNTND